MTDHGIFSSLLITLQPVNFFACFVGAVIGTLVGVLPGLGPAAAMALVIPLTLKLGPTAGLIMLAGIYYGSMYGGSTTSILVNVPGEPASVVTTLDGYAMAKKGRAGAALAIAAIGSFVAGTFSVIALQFFAPLLARSALAFGPAEYFCPDRLRRCLTVEPDREIPRQIPDHDDGRFDAFNRRDGSRRRCGTFLFRPRIRPGGYQLYCPHHRPVWRCRGLFGDGEKRKTGGLIAREVSRTLSQSGRDQALRGTHRHAVLS